MFYFYAALPEMVPAGGPAAAPFTPSEWRFADDALPTPPRPEMAVPLLLLPAPVPPPITPLFMNTAKISFV